MPFPWELPSPGAWSGITSDASRCAKARGEQTGSSLPAAAGEMLDASPHAQLLEGADYPLERDFHCY